MGDCPQEFKASRHLMSRLVKLRDCRACKSAFCDISTFVTSLKRREL